MPCIVLFRQSCCLVCHVSLASRNGHSTVSTPKMVVCLYSQWMVDTCTIRHAIGRWPGFCATFPIAIWNGIESVSDAEGNDNDSQPINKRTRKQKSNKKVAPNWPLGKLKWAGEERPSQTKKTAAVHSQHRCRKRIPAMAFVATVGRLCHFTRSYARSLSGCQERHQNDWPSITRSLCHTQMQVQRTDSANLFILFICLFNRPIWLAKRKYMINKHTGKCEGSGRWLSTDWEDAPEVTGRWAPVSTPLRIRHEGGGRRRSAAYTPLFFYYVGACFANTPSLTFFSWHYKQYERVKVMERNRISECILCR